jgi:hypothetical protein
MKEVTMKRQILSIGVMLISVLVLFTISAAQEAVIVIEAWSPQEIKDLGWTSPHSSGLKVVGKGELVYLFGKEASGETVTAFAWSLTSVPTGSQATLDSTTTQRTTFRPDTTGQFDIQLSITTASGTADTSVTITSAKYVGVGTLVPGVDPSFSEGQCGLCHPGNEATWKNTGHASMFTEAIDGLKSPFYRETCIECHTVGFNEDITAVNGGFDDVAEELGWVFPDTLQIGNWDDIATNFPDLAQVSNIQCENCHGPGSLHKGDKSKIDLTLDEGICGTCHEEEPYHRKNIQWKRSAHSEGIGFAAARPECAECHSGYGFINKVDPASALDQTTGFPQTTCQVCHDPHDAGLEHQVRNLDDVTLNNGESFTFGGLGKLCMNCHLSRRDSEVYVQEYHRYFGPHYSNQADMLAGANAITFGRNIPSSNHKEVVADACVTCHMAETPGKGLPGRDYVGEHTFTMHWDGGTPDEPSDDVYNVTACQTCHGTITTFDDILAKVDYDRDGTIESAQDEIRGLMDEVGELLPPLGVPEVDVTQEDYDPTLTGLTPEEVAQRKLFLKAAYNYKFVEEDGSYGIHNFQYAVNLLRASYNALTTGSLGAGTIESITDVPNDQGKQVRIVWTRFGGDGAGDDPVQNYAIWRRVDDNTSNTSEKAIPVYQSLEMIPANLAELSESARVQFDQKLWDFAGAVPASGLDKYSAIAPTLFDSTQTDGMHWSVFIVSGHTAIPAVFAVTAPDSGYSLDNLAPAAPANLAGEEVETGIQITWDESVDEDFNYFALYRSLTSGFDPKTVEPIAKLTETSYVDSDVIIGLTYHYRLSAFDFSGNESAFSPQLSLLVTSVEGAGSNAIPEDYVLEQNYPNPFNPSTTINFGLKESGHVTLAVYNALGEEVMKVIDRDMEAGYHRAVIRAHNLTSGLYFYKIHVNEFVSVKKMVVIK